jgi:cytochrome c-type biogenesis protein CcmF
VDYAGEQPVWGQLGHFFVVLAFVTAIFSVVANLLRIRATDLATTQGWKITARSLYITHAAAVFGIFLTLLLMLIYHRFEYQYVWQHSKRDMSMNYVLACLWEGQEGSTLLWLFWHAVIGLVLTFRARDWEAPVMSVISLVQVFLSMMLLGWYLGDVHMGSNPFELIRQREENIGLPWTQLPDYLQRIPLFQDGRGLNPLLQNYWMTIHPPTLFLGFALTTVPFAFAIGALWTKRYHDWQKAALPWAFTGVMVLGTGILMGGAWAYESLSFGGFWAWDPVENASLVPWLTLVGAAHVMLIYRIKGQSLFTTFFMCIITFLLIVYSTFLTKSGILSDTSVHAFTEDGLNQELTLFMGFFLWVSITLLASGKKLRIFYTVFTLLVFIAFLFGYHSASMLALAIGSLVTMIVGYINYFPQEEKEEELWSREFWMFIGSLVLLLAAFQIIFWTSSPVINKFISVFTGKPGTLAPGKDVVYFYNKWQIGFAFIIASLVAVTQFFKYRKTDMKDFRRSLLVPLCVSVAITTVLVLVIYYNSSWNSLPLKRKWIDIMCTFLLYAVVFNIAANGTYWIRIMKGKIRHAGASIAHIGFGLLLLGIVISTSKKDTISRNTSRMDVRAISNDGDNETNIYLRRNQALPMGKYLVKYTGRERRIKDGTPYVYFNVEFKEMGNPENTFTLSPFIQINKFMGNAAEPATKHYLHKDIYTFVKFVPMSALEDTAAAANEKGDLFDKPRNYTVSIGDTLALENCIAILDSVTRLPETDTFKHEHEVALAGNFRVFDASMNASFLKAVYTVDTLTGATRQKDAVDEEKGVKLTLWKIRPQTGKFDIYASVKFSQKADFIVLEASVFPGINILWLGCLIMIAGTCIAVVERVRSRK